MKALNWLKGRTENAAVLVETYKNGDSFYRKYSDGFIVQGGYFANRDSGGTNPQTVTLPISFTTKTYKVFRNPKQIKGSNSLVYSLGSYDQTTSSFKMHNDSNSWYEGTYWMAFGY